jgi:hypothetical protein
LDDTQSLNEMKIPLDLVEICKAYNLASATTNRAWLAAVTLSIVGLTGSTSSTSLFVSGLGVHSFYVVVAIILAALNFRICATQMNLYAFQAMILRYLRDTDANKVQVSESLPLSDVAHRLRAMSYNRLYPMLHFTERDTAEAIMSAAKAKFDVLYLFLPIAGMLNAMVRCTYAIDNQQATKLQLGLTYLVIVCVLAQLMLSTEVLHFAAKSRSKLAKEVGLE